MFNYFFYQLQYRFVILRGSCSIHSIKRDNISLGHLRAARYTSCERWRSTFVYYTSTNYIQWPNQHWHTTICQCWRDHSFYGVKILGRNKKHFELKLFIWDRTQYSPVPECFKCLISKEHYYCYLRNNLFLVFFNILSIFIVFVFSITVH